MRSPGINGEGELRGQPANPHSLGKMAVKTECVNNNNNNNNNKHFKRPLTNVTKARAATQIPWPIHICQSEQKRFQHLPKGSQCDCRIMKCSW